MRYATPKQVNLIDRMVNERQMDNFPYRDRVQQVVARQAHGFSIEEASAIIDGMFKLPKINYAAAAPGYYVKNGNVYVVVENKAKTATYAKKMVVLTNAKGAKVGRWEYAPGVGRNIAAEGLAPLTVTEAARLGRLHGACMVCGRTLTDPNSVERGIGPVCAGKL